jgi:hypothetical protein
MNLQTILFILIAFGLGYGFAMLDRRVTSGMRARREEAKQQQQPKVVEQIVPERSALSLLLDDPDNPRVRMDGAGLTPGQMTPDQRKRLITLLNLFRPWVDAGPAPTPAPQAAPTVGGAASAAESKQPAPSLDVARGFRAMMYNAVITQEPSQGAGIVRQIDAVLQEKLPASPYAEQDIHLSEGPTGEVLVLVGAQKFEGIDAVPDAGIQSVIREAISEWEKRGGR